LDGGFWANGIMMGVCFLVNFMTSSSDPHANFLARSIFGFSAQIRVFRSLDQVLAFLVQKLSQIYSEYFRNVPWAAKSNPNGLLGQKLCHGLNQGRTL